MSEKVNKPSIVFPEQQQQQPQQHLPSSMASSSRRDRASSLSIARSPSVLSSSFGTPPDQYQPHTPSSLSPTHPSGTYVQSLSVAPDSYSNSLSLGIKSLALNRTRTLPPASGVPTLDGVGGKSLTRTATVPTTLKEEDEARERYMSGFANDFNSSQVDDEEEYLSDEDVQGVGGLMGGRDYGGFQKPDKKELVWMLSSLGGVLLISVAACLTTVYDWVF
ncbi:hypothetical protein BD324DRAFT_611824 [Kockovaella imperatae]|uniref:Uncharacterized protein n=1 Tax=Kockovaella imperatae TaxID=4999 RepID=A0A1Y1UT45_9TREE|nr:hypothetical protein BD324DRAFT_611824 [Kockovaella imperatae]ORX40704.1 hypothetical protein BD324DRAFT_611824 [Kockovaella imperatae]